MANTLTNLVPLLFSAAREVPRELTGLIGAIRTDFSDKGVAKGGTVSVPISPVQATANVTEAQTFTVGSNRTPTVATLTLNNYKETSWVMTAEDERMLENSDTAKDVFKQTVAQGLRALVNAMESSVGTTMRAAASRGTGTAGTTPFGTNINIIADAGQILTDNGAGLMDRSLVINTAAGTKLRQIANLYKVSEAGSSDMLKRGILGSLFGFDMRESAGLPTAVTAGTGTSYTSDTTGYAIGTTSIPVITGSGTILAGDVVTFTGDTNKYIVKTGLAAPGTLVIQEPGLKAALAASAVAMTIGAAATANLAFCKNSTVLVARPALQPSGAIAEQMVITDPQSGLSFLLLRAPGNGLASWYLRVVYDSFCPNPYAIAQVLG